MLMPKPAASKLGQKYTYRPPEAGHPLLLGAPLHRLHDGSPLPASVDLRAMALPVRDQGREGACSGFATAAFKEIGCGFWGGGKEPLGGYLSPAYLYGRTRMAEGTFPADSGATVADEFAVLQTYGACPETFLPYKADPSQAPTPQCDVAALPYRCGQPLVVDYANPDNLKAVLAQNKPVVIGFKVYESFELTGPGGLVPMPDVASEGVLGGHAVCVVGYDTIAGGLCWLVRNSWGSSWAASGYCWMPAAYTQFWWEALTTPPSPPGQ